MREIDVILAGGIEAQSPAEIARANAEAMAALGQVGGVPPRKRKKKAGA